MGTPAHISQCPLRFLPDDKESAEFQALTLITESLAHPQRTLLRTFIDQSLDRENASRFLLDEVLGRDKATVTEFLADWISLLRKVRPVICQDIDQNLKQDIWRRDAGKCCISKAHNGKKYNEDPLIAYILPPTLFCDRDMAQDGRLYAMLKTIIGESQSDQLRLLLQEESHSHPRDSSDQLLLLSPRMFKHFENGRVSLQSSRPSAENNTAKYFVSRNSFIPHTPIDVPFYSKLENRAIDSTSLPNAQLLNIHYRFAPALAWLEVYDYMTKSCTSLSKPRPQVSTSLATKRLATQNWIQGLIRPAPRIFQYIWTKVPGFLRAFTYKHFAWLGRRLYGYTGSERTYRLPFNLYLRVSSRDWMPKHEAEIKTLQMIEKYTEIPAPRGVDTVQDATSSYLLMTGLPGRGIGQMMSVMTDQQVDTVKEDLEDYISQMRQIPNETGSEFQICNPLGAGILDWRIGDSQREELTFRNTTDFHQYLARHLPLNDEQRKQVSKAHSAEHAVVFTHADLNLRNILVDEHGRISGIVDWECAGWYPEYWEYTKMHFTVRAMSRWLADVVEQIFEGYKDELIVEDMSAAMLPSW